MEVSIGNQLLIAVYSLLYGVVLGAVYDAFRIGRIFFGINYVNRFTGHIKCIKLPLISNPMLNDAIGKSQRYKNTVVFIGDVLYFVLITPPSTVFVYAFNNGNVRWYLFFGIVAGFATYYFTVGRLVISVSEYIVFSVKVLFSYVAYFTVRPIKKAANFLFSKIRKAACYIKSKMPKISIKIPKKEKRRTTLIRMGKIEQKSRLP